MASLRIWVVGTALACFGSGLLVGRALAPVAAQAAPGFAGDLAYAEDLAARYGLSADQHRRLCLVLQHAAEREIEILRSAQFEQLPQPQHGELRALGIATEQRIRKLLDAEQLSRYDRDSRPVGPTPPPADPQKR